MRYLAAGIVIVLVTLWISFFREGERKDPETGKVVRNEDVSSPSISNIGRIRFIEENPFALEYGEEGGNIKRDLEALRDVVTSCQLIMKNFDTFHLPGNPEIVRFLRGGNPEMLAWIPREHPHINADGELLDRNGTPIHFHRLSGLRIEYRSAGADGKHWTDDDVVVR